MASKVESESYIPVGTIYFEEREDGLLHEKEALKRTMLQHELTFKNQVHELHRLYQVQRDLMQEYQRNNNNNSQTNSISSQIPPTENEIMESNEIKINNNTNNNFEFIREGSAQSSSKHPIISSSSQIENISNLGKSVVNLNEDGNGSISIFGKRLMDLNEDGNGPNFGKRVMDLKEDGNGSDFGKQVADLKEDGNGSNFGKRVLDLNGGGNGLPDLNGSGIGVPDLGKGVMDLNEAAKEKVDNGSGLDFMGVNKQVGFVEGSNIGHDKEKGGNSNSTGINNFFANPLPINNNSNNNINNNNSIFFPQYKGPQQQSIIFPNQFSVPQLFGQSLTINFDPSQNNNSNDNSIHNTNNISYPVLDSSPHYMNLDRNKNRSSIPNFLHPVPVPGPVPVTVPVPIQIPVFNNGSFSSGITGTSESLSKYNMDSSYYFNNFSRNLSQSSFNLPRNPHPVSLFGNSKLNWERNLNLNEPVSEGLIQVNNNDGNNNNNNNNNKGVMIFGANCERSIKSSTGEDSKKPSISVTTGVVPDSSNLTKILGFPVFSNPTSLQSVIIPVQDSIPVQSQPNLVQQISNSRTIFDLNEDYSPLDNNNHTDNINNKNNNLDRLKEINEGKKPIIFDLNEDLSNENDPLVFEAANNIISFANALKTAQARPDSLSWFVDIATTGQPEPDIATTGPPDLLPEPETETDSFEQTYLNLKPVEEEDRFGPGKYDPKKYEDEGESSNLTGQTGYGSLLFTRGKRGPARKRRLKRDFQRDVLPALASLSRVEVTEDLQMIGGLVRASGQEFDMALTRRVGRSGSNKAKRQQQQQQQQQQRRTPQSSEPPSRIAAPQRRSNERTAPAGSQTGPQVVNIPFPLATAYRQGNLPPRFPQMNMPFQMNLLQMNQQHRGPQGGAPQSIVGPQQQSVIGWGQITRRARRPRGPVVPAQQQQQQQQ